MGSLGVLGGIDDLVAVTMQQPGAKMSASSPHEVDWERYGLVKDVANTTAASALGASQGGGGDDEDGSGNNGLFRGKTPRDNELFAEDQSSSSKPWWKANFFLSEPALFGTWDGVFTTCMINIFGVIVFLRSGWMVAEAGIGLAVLVVLTSTGVILITVSAAIGICSRCQVQRGGVYFLISHVLGARIGGAVGVLYCFGQSVGAAIHIIGFGESMGLVFHLENVWLERGIGSLILLLLIAINLIGVTWVIKLQFVLLLTLLFAALDFTVGSFVRTDPVHGVDGYYSYNFRNNSGPAFTDHNNWFSIFGVFFPTLTGILAGINMSGDLRNPSRDIPVGTLSALGLSTFLYMVFVLVLGATCQRAALYTDFMIAQKVSAIGFLMLAGLYISSLSSTLGGLYGTPRVLQTIASENVIPFMRMLARGRGPNKIPVVGILVVGAIVLLFVFIGEINTLGPVVTMSFLLTYSATEYAYFSLAMTFDIQQRREERMRSQGLTSPTFDKTLKSPQGSEYGSVFSAKTKIMERSGNDLDTLFPERNKQRSPMKKQYSSQTSSLVSSPDEHSSINSQESWTVNNSRNVAGDSHEGVSDFSQLIPKGHHSGIGGKSHVWYTDIGNRWIALLGVLTNLVIMFLVHWIFALVNITLMWMIYFYISHANPGVPPGVAEFKLLPWLQYGFKRLIGRGTPEYDQIVVTPMHPGVEVTSAQLTADNEDYATRERYHQSSVMSGAKIDGMGED